MLIAIISNNEKNKKAINDFLIKNHLFTKLDFEDVIIEEIKENFDDLLKTISRVTGIKKEALFNVRPTLIKNLIKCYAIDIRYKENSYYWISKWNYKRLQYTSCVDILVSDVKSNDEIKNISLAGGLIIKIIDKENDDGLKADFKIIDNGNNKKLLKNVDDFITKLKNVQ